MQGESTFSSNTPSTSVESAPVVTPRGNDATIATSAVEVPYLDYHRTHGQPLSVDYFGIGDTWNDPQGGFPKEISTIESYFEEKISNGDLPNSIKAVENHLKDVLKITGMNKEERNVVRIQVIAEYMKFLRRTDDIRQDVRRYGSTS